jgi:hypothetical protein
VRPPAAVFEAALVAWADRYLDDEDDDQQEEAS